MRDYCLSVSVSGNPAGRDKVSKGLAASCRFQSQAKFKHAHTFRCVCVSRRSVIARQVVSMHLHSISEGHGYVARGSRRGLGRPTPCVNIRATPTLQSSAPSVASGGAHLSQWLEAPVDACQETPWPELTHPQHSGVWSHRRSSSVHQLDICSVFSGWNLDLAEEFVLTERFRWIPLKDHRATSWLPPPFFFTVFYRTYDFFFLCDNQNWS